MSFRALLYTAAAIAFFMLMINRPAVELHTLNNDTTTSNAGQVNSAALTITATDVSDTDTSTQTNDDTDQISSTSNESDQNQSAADNSANSTATQTSDSTETANTTTQTDSATQTVLTDNNTQNTNNAENNNQSVANATPDYARERRMSNEIRDAILEGEIFYLNDGNRSFMSIQTDADEKRGGTLILHGRGFHPDWEDTVNPLRTGLAENGWTTLSLQMPVLAKDAKYNDYVSLFAEAGKRIQAGIRHLKQQGISPITVVAHSCGAHMAMQWIRDNGDADIAAYVGLGMGATDAGQFMAEPFPLDKMQVPVLDVYGEDDFPAVIKMAPDRWTQITTAGNPASAQRMLPGADHYFTDKGDELVGIVSTWLNDLKQ